MLSSTDILIQPALENFGALQFEKTLAAAEPGRRATQAAAPQLAALALNAEQYDRHLAARALHGQVERDWPSQIGFVDIINRSTINSEAIRSRLAFAVGDPIDRDLIERGIANVYGMDVFQRIDYRLVERDETVGLEIEVVSKPWGPNYLQFGLRLSEDFATGSDFDLGIAYLRTAVNDLGGEWRAQLDLGERQGLSFNWYQPMSHRSGRPERMGNTE